MSNNVIGYKERMIINVIIDVIRKQAEVMKCKDDVSIYFPIGLEEMASLSNLSVKQIKSILGSKQSKIHYVISISHPRNIKERISYSVNFEKVKELNALASHEKIYKGLHGEETREQLLKRLADEAALRKEQAMSRKKY